LPQLLIAQLLKALARFGQNDRTQLVDQRQPLRRDSQKAYASVSRVLAAFDQSSIHKPLNDAGGDVGSDAQRVSDLVDGDLPAGEDERERAELLERDLIVE
jgi:hypothetical protein